MFRLVNGPTQFQCLPYELGQLRNSIGVCYLDDTRGYVAELALCLSKQSLGKNQVEFLDFVISEDGIRPGPAEVKAVSDFLIPRYIHKVRRFLGLTSVFVASFLSMSHEVSQQVD